MPYIASRSNEDQNSNRRLGKRGEQTINKKTLVFNTW